MNSIDQEYDPHVALAEDRGARRRLLPAWVGSLLVHMLAVVVLAIVVRSPTPPGDPEVREVNASIVLKQIGPTGEYYQGENDQPQQAESAAPSSTQPSEVLPTEAEAPGDPSSALPSTDFGSQFNEPGGGNGGGNPALDVGTGTGERNLEGGKATTSVFGIQSEGYSFVYVFDNSASMGSPSSRAVPEGMPLRAAKDQLLASVDSLAKTHQFQIIFYNSEPHVLNITGVAGSLVFGTESNKQRARTFVEAIRARLNTNHEPALTKAIRMNPDVIFFLTDADDPVLSDDQMRRFARMNAGRAIINTIEFGTGAPPTRPNFLQRLAHENRGQYRYVNVRELRPQF